MQHRSPPSSSPPIIHNFRCRNNCHKHALFVQPAQTRLSFDICLMLSPGTAAGHRKQRTGKTVAAWVTSDSSSCYGSVSPSMVFRCWAQISLVTPKANQLVHSNEAGETLSKNNLTVSVDVCVCVCKHWKIFLTSENSDSFWMWIQQ